MPSLHLSCVLVCNNMFVCMCFSLQHNVCLSWPSTVRWGSRSPRPKCTCPHRSPPRSWRWSASPRPRTALMSPRRGVSTRCKHKHSDTLPCSNNSFKSFICMAPFIQGMQLECFTTLM